MDTRKLKGNQLTTSISNISFSCVQIVMTRNYDHSTFFEDLRKFYFNSGALDTDTVFLFTDTQIVQEEFLEDINNILNSGIVLITHTVNI